MKILLYNNPNYNNNPSYNNNPDYSTKGTILNFSFNVIKLINYI